MTSPCRSARLLTWWGSSTRRSGPAALDLPRALSLLAGPDASALVRASASHRPRVVLLHGDLKGEHLLVRDGQLSGVLDWADAGTGPVRLDVEGLAVAVGAERAASVAESAGVEPAEAELGVLLARCRTTLRLAALRRGEPSGPGPLLAKQWRRAWEGTPGQDDGVR